VGCETDKPTSSGTAVKITSLAQLVAQRLYDSGNGTINAEVTGRTTQIEVNADGTKTIDKRSECLLCFSDVDLSNSSNLCISSLRLINGFFNTPLWLLTVSAF
jgi:hypothetical protein